MCDIHLYSDSCSPSYLADFSSEDESYKTPLRSYSQYTPPSPADSPRRSLSEKSLFTKLPTQASYHHEQTPYGLCTPESLPGTDEHRISPRKQLNPRKSPLRFDPEFQGVTAAFKFTVEENLTPLLDFELFYSLGRARARGWTNRARKWYSAHHAAPEWGELSYYKRVSHGHPHGKQCASCNTRKTPLWRDAEDGTPLCNACGIRYKKYRVRCSHCWHIPKKENKSYARCPSCGDYLKFTLNRNKYTR